MIEQVYKTRKSNNFTFNDEIYARCIKVTENVVKFLQHDSGIDERKRFIIFGTESNIIQL